MFLAYEKTRRRIRESVTCEEGLAPLQCPKLPCATLEDHRCLAPLPHHRFTEQDQVQSSTSLMWPSRGAHDTEGRATCGAWGPLWLLRLRVLAARVFIFL
ncbi:hypothetical protein CXB51_006093 [Gossypium anomalum]|uniref:Uncharacterized protein n=1 Tax=Gossypium anomalum TaxID=47600 RepID=A0A8J5ZD22_9ROSI|nr:hypothetical protein CXB51_006093 [Gossypium anomalum]